MQKLQLLLYLMSISQVIYPSGYIPVSKYNISTNLSNSEVTSLFIDSKQFLWIGTSDGLNRFDGYNFSKYYAKTADSLSLPDDHILKITEDKYGSIWCATATSIVKFQEKYDKFATILSLNDINSESQSPLILDMVSDNKGERMFILGRFFLGGILTQNNQIDKYLTEDRISQFESLRLTSIDFNNQQNKIILNNRHVIYIGSPDKSVLQPVNDLPEEIISGDGIQKIISGKSNLCYICSKNSIWQLDVVTLEIKKIKLPDGFDEKLNSIIDISLINNDLIQIVANNKIIEFQIGEIHSEDVFDFNIDEKGRYKITSEVHDSAGVWWIGTNTGLFKFNPHNNVFNNIYLNNLIKISDNEYVNLGSFLDKNNIMLVMNSGRILHLNMKEKNIHEYKWRSKSTDTQINSINANSIGNQLLSTNDGLIFLKDYNSNRKSFGVEERFLDGQFIYASVFENDSVWVVSKTGVYLISLNNNTTTENKPLSDFLAGKTVISIKSSDRYLWIHQSRKIIEYDKKTKGIYTLTIPTFSNNQSPLINEILSFENNKLLIGTSDGLFLYSADNKKNTSIDPSFRLSNSFVNALGKSSDGKIWVSTNEGLLLFDILTGKERLYNESDGLNIHDFKQRFTGISAEGQLFFGGSESLVLFHPDSIVLNTHIPKIEFTESYLSGKNIESKIHLTGKDSLIFGPDYNSLTIEFTSLDFWDPGKNEYMYSFEKTGSDEKWENISSRNFITLRDLKNGYYKLSIRGSNNDGLWSNPPKTLIIQVIGSYWKNSMSFIIYFLLFIILFYSAVFFRTKHFRSLNKKYLEREQVTIKIEQQKEELTQKNKNITDSLNYARRIQMALMPSQKIFTKFFPDSFILHIPKDIVSGDFYWVNEVDNRIYFAAVDCTGHGVPGAFMSIIGFELFRRITEMDKKKQPAIILDSLSLGFEHIFRDVESHTLRDGMDVAFCAIDKDMKVLEFAGAFNPIYIIRENTIIEIKGDRFSVGLYGEENQIQFKNHVIPLLEGDIIYIFTDGFADQFGGPEGKKYKYRRFRHLLLALHQLPMERQLEFLRRSINDWRGDLDQVDDVLVIGVRVQQSVK